MRALIIAVCIAASGCGPAFTEESEPEVLILETGVWQAPPAEDVCVDRPRAVRQGPDAGGGRR